MFVCTGWYPLKKKKKKSGGGEWFIKSAPPPAPPNPRMRGKCHLHHITTIINQESETFYSLLFLSCSIVSSPGGGALRMQKLMSFALHSKVQCKSEDNFVCFVHCQDFCFIEFLLCGLFSFIYFQASSNIRWRVTWAVSRIFFKPVIWLNDSLSLIWWLVFCPDVTFTVDWTLHGKSRLNRLTVNQIRR